MAYLVYTTKKIHHVAATVTKTRFVGRNSQIYYNNLHNRLYTVFKIRVILFKKHCHGPTLFYVASELLNICGRRIVPFNKD